MQQYCCPSLWQHGEGRLGAWVTPALSTQPSSHFYADLPNIYDGLSYQSQHIRADNSVKMWTIGLSIQMICL